MEIIVGAIFEFLLQFLANFIFTSLARTCAGKFIKDTNLMQEIFYVLGVAFSGFTLGFLSLLAHDLLIKPHTIQVVNLIVTPLFIGLVFFVSGKIRVKKNIAANTSFLYQFVGPYFFAFAFASARYFLSPMNSGAI